MHWVLECLYVPLLRREALALGGRGSKRHTHDFKRDTAPLRDRGAKSGGHTECGEATEIQTEAQR